MWIESHANLRSHKKLIPFAQDIGLENAHAIGHLHCLWYACLEQAEDGDLITWDNRAIAELAGFKGDANKFVKSLQRHGWLDMKLVHDWLDYSSKYLISKYSTSNKVILKQIWAKHGKNYGTTKKVPKQKGEPWDKVPQERVREVVRAYIDLKGWDLDTTDMLIEVIKRNYKTARRLFQLCKGDLAEVTKAIAWTKETQSHKGLEWKLDTVGKLLPEYMTSKNKAKVVW